MLFFFLGCNELVLGNIYGVGRRDSNTSILSLYMLSMRFEFSLFMLGSKFFSRRFSEVFQILVRFSIINSFYEYDIIGNIFMYGNVFGYSRRLSEFSNSNISNMVVQFFKIYLGS